MPFDTDTPIMYHGHRITIEQDLDPSNPRTEYDNAATMVFSHKRYNVGDDHGYANPCAAIQEICGLDEEPPMEREAHETALNAARIIWLPVYMYDHSGVTISTSPFSCPWDSGQLGIVYITYEKIIEEYDLKPLDPKTWEPNDETREKALNLLKGEVSTYDNYLTGSVYGYRVEKLIDIDNDEWEETDSCWGFFGDDDYIITAAKETISVEP